jgi:hypothetical protein
MDPVGDTGSWMDEVAPFLYKNVTGNFVVATHVAAGSQNNANVPPGSDYNMAGLFVRADVPLPAVGQEDWIKWEIGRRDPNIPPLVGLLAARAIDSVSMHVTPHPQYMQHVGALGVCRLDDSIGLYWRVGAGDWIPTHQLTPMSMPGIADLPDTVQVGLIAGAFYAQDDLRAQFDYIRFGPTPPNNGAECEQTLEAIAP